MASAATFVVSLIDKVTGPSRNAAKAVEDLNSRLKKTGSIGYKYTGKGKVPDVIERLNSGALKTFVGSKVATGAGKAIDAVADKAFTVSKYAALGIGAAGAAAGAMIVKGTVEMAMFQDTAMTAFKSLTGSAQGGDKAWQASIGLAHELGMGVEDTTNSMKHLLAMQFTLPEAQEMVRMSADLKAVTGDAHSAERALTAITQIKAKGKLQAEELVGQLAEAGVSTTLVYQELQKSMNLKSVGDVQKAITAGKVDSNTGIAAIKAAIAHKTHSSSTGAAGRDYAQTTYSGLIGQLQNAPQFLFVRLGESIKANLEKFKPIVQKITQAIDDIKGDQMTVFVGNVLTFVERLVPLGLEFAKGFGEGFGAMNEALGGLDPSKASMETARDLGRAIAKGFEMAFDVIKKVADLVLWLDQHRNVAVGIAGMLAIDKIAGGGATAKGAWAVGKGVLSGGTALAQGAGLAGAARAAFGIGTAATTAAAAAGTTAATVAGTTAVAGGGLTGTAALAAGLTTAAGGAAALGGGALLGAGIGYIFREEIANWLYGTGGVQGTRGLGAPTPTSTLTGLQGATAKATTNNVRFESAINIDGANHDPNEIARSVSDQQRGMMEQFFQSSALETGAAG